MSKILDYSSHIFSIIDTEIGWLTTDREQAGYVNCCRLCGTDSLVVTRLSGQPLYDAIGPAWTWTSSGTTIVDIEILECQGCGWWQLEELTNDEVGSDRGGQYFLHKASLREFSVDALTTPVEILAEHIKSKSSLIHEIHPSKMEELVGSVFRDFFSCEVVHCGRSHDGGIDLLLIQGETTIPIQVKRRVRPDAVELVSTVREMFSVLFRDGFRHGKVVSTAKRFSRGSLDEVEKVLANNLCESFELINLDAFLSMLDLHRGKKLPSWLEWMGFWTEEHRTRFATNHLVKTSPPVRTRGMLFRFPMVELLREAEEAKKIKSWLGRLHSDKLDPLPVSTVEEVLTYLKDQRVSWAAREALSRMVTDDLLPFLPALRELLKDTVAREHTIDVLKQLGPEAQETAPDLIHIVRNWDEEFREDAFCALIAITPDISPILPMLVECLKDNQRELDTPGYWTAASLRRSVLTHLQDPQYIARKEVRSAFRIALKDNQWMISSIARSTLERIGEEVPDKGGD